jgi:ABC-type multidrug transport system permease subunit
MNRAAISAAVFFAVLVLVLRQPAGTALALSLFMLLVYIPMGYAIDSFVYRVRQRRKQRKQAESSG